MASRKPTPAERHAYYKKHRAWEMFARRLRLYGLTLDAYHAMFEQQTEKCFSCGTVLRAMNASKVGADVDVNAVDSHIDHDHTTLRVRGLLCAPCNVLAGWVVKLSNEGWAALARLREQLVTSVPRA